MVILKAAKLAFTSARTSCGKEVENYLESFRPDIILASPSPAIEITVALETCMKNKPDTFFLVLSENTSVQFALSILRKGAFDIVMKSELVRLPAVVKAATQQQRQENSR